jgi:ACS family hexuronate transporter-like MFS transporter
MAEPGGASVKVEATVRMAVDVPEATAAAPRFGYRWTICAMLFFATTINYVDRQVIGILGPTLQHDLHWTPQQFGDVLSWFQFAYGVGFLFAGRLLDRIGVKKGFVLAIVTWSLAAMSHAFARTQLAFSLARGALGLGESGNFPASIKAVAEWFPKKERALATGIFNAGSNVGAVIAPIVVPFVTLTVGPALGLSQPWRLAFFFTSILVVIWVVLWLRIYHEPARHPRISKAELAFIHSDAAAETNEDAGPSIPLTQLLKHRQAWGFIIAKGMTDPVWWFYLFWLPTFLDMEYHVKLAGLAAPLVAIYVLADFGSIFGGWLSGALIKRGRSVNFGRKTAMIIAALLIVPTMLAPRAGSMWVAVAIVGLAAASHQWWSANVFTCASDMFPRKAVATMVGLASFLGAMIGMGFQRAVGHILVVTHNNYGLIFVYCGLAYVTAWAILQVLAPRLKPVELG